jgi:heme-degrading monooxygenase HmoA
MCNYGNNDAAEDPMKAVTLINSFEVPAGREDEFFRLWQQVNVYMQAKPGYISHTLYRSLAPDACFRFVNVAQWASAEHFHAAHDEGFRAMVNKPDWEAFRPNPTLYQSVHEGHAKAVSAA